MGQTHDLLAAVAEALTDAVLVGAVCFGDGNLPVFDRDRIVTAVRGLKHHFLIHTKIDSGGFAAIFFCANSDGAFCVGSRTSKRHSARIAPKIKIQYLFFNVITSRQAMLYSVRFCVEEYNKNMKKTQEKA